MSRFGLLAGAATALALSAGLGLAQQSSTEAAVKAATQGAPATEAAAPAATAAADPVPLLDDAALRELAAQNFQPIPQEPVVPKGNELTPARIDLGRALFFDPRMSASQLISCQTCHNVGLGGVDQQPTSIGHGWQMGPRNAPTVLNAVFNIAQFWDGRAPDLAEQAKGPVQAGVEMHNKPANVEATLRSMPAYVEMFKAAFPGQDQPVSFDNFAHAIEAFEATLITPNSRFDKFLAGDNAALAEGEKRGLQAFVEGGCANCHNGINVGGQDYFPFGVMENPGEAVLPKGDQGRFKVTNTEGDQYVFRAAPLRNVALTPPYFHSGKVWSLDEAVKIMSNAQLGSALTDAQARDIADFLDALNGDQPQVTHPILPERTADTPRPAPM